MTTVTPDEIMKRLNEVFADVLENQDIQIGRNTTSAEVPEWDSLNHIMLVVEIEKEFNIQFVSGEVNGFRNVGEMADAIRSKMSS
jgi:acyl carrier protein